MNNRNFTELIQAKWNEGKFLCVGLDPLVERLPEHLRGGDVGKSVETFLCAIIDATADLACCYKPNSAFYDRLGVDGMAVLLRVMEYAKTRAPGAALILDAKRGDIQDTNVTHAAVAFDLLGVDAVTVQPYLGSASLEPYLKRKEKGTLVLCKTSNPGAGELQDVMVDGLPLYQFVAKRAQEQWNGNGNCGLVMGATYPKELSSVRALGVDLPFLIPGVGAQGGTVAETVAAAKDRRGQGMIINASRAILYASSGKDFAEAAAREAKKMHDGIKAALT